MPQQIGLTAGYRSSLVLFLERIWRPLRGHAVTTSFRPGPPTWRAGPGRCLPCGSRHGEWAGLLRQSYQGSGDFVYVGFDVGSGCARIPNRRRRQADIAIGDQVLMASELGIRAPSAGGAPSWSLSVGEASAGSCSPSMVSGVLRVGEFDVQVSECVIDICPDTERSQVEVASGRSGGRRSCTPSGERAR